MIFLSNMTYPKSNFILTNPLLINYLKNICNYSDDHNMALLG